MSEEYEHVDIVDFRTAVIAYKSGLLDDEATKRIAFDMGVDYMDIIKEAEIEDE
jgi:hypothetical protein